MRTPLRKIAIAIAAAVTIVGTTAALPTAADAAWHGHGGHWHGGGGHWHGGGWDFGTGLALGFGAPYYGGYYAYDPYPYDGGCAMRRRPVINRYGHRVWRWVRVCY